METNIKFLLLLSLLVFTSCKDDKKVDETTNSLPEKKEFYHSSKLDALWIILFLPGIILGIFTAFQFDLDAYFSRFYVDGLATLFGIFLGVMFSLYIENLREFLSNTFNISLFPEEIYFLSTMPSEINPTSIFIISLCSISITIIVSIFPAIKASKLDPVKGLKYE